ncbi:ankyrin repeat domain-containing protein 26-like isoform X4 [Ostrea edulis]|uniref:ankyrin repeat domain-containing protein 26-like isoform X4 n=1 Tax=Ostrea edulis TaxID=37623 RepID=UPI0024AECF8D|nr:ankyrin repeat domain-containing protein 26-like isoform X4 [Ostrea edulis]
MKKFIKTIRKKTQGKGSYDPQEAAATGGASGGAETGYEVREKDLPKLHKAAWTGDLSKVVQLVKKDTSALDKENRTALHLACARGHADIVKVLLEWHAKSNVGDGESKTPLLKAVECGHDDCVKLLIEHNAQLDTVDRKGNSAVHLAVLYNHPRIVKILTERGATVNLRNKTEEGLAPLHMSIQLKREEITKILLIAKANPDIQDLLGRTPLMLACYDGAITPIRMLLQFNANTIIKDKKGFTAEDMANMTGQYAAAQLLSDHAMKLRRSTGGGSIAGSITPRETPRGSMGASSASTTPRDPSLTNMLPANNIDKDDSEEETTQSRISHSQQDDSWADDSISLGPDTKKKEDAPKMSLAAKLPTFPDSEPDDDDLEEDEQEDQRVPPSNILGRQQQGSVKSNQSHTSIEDNIPYDSGEEEDEEEREPAKKRMISVNRVSFRDESEIREITDDNDTTDVEESEESGSGPKRPKLDDQPQKSTAGYVPTGVANLSPSSSIDREKQREKDSQGEAFLADLGIDDECDSGPEISDVSDPPLPATQPPKITGPDNEESEWDSTQVTITPRPGILKNWAQASQEEVEKNAKKTITPRSDGSEWDSDLEADLDPDRDIGVDNRVKARYEVTHFSDNDDGLSDSEESEVVPKPKRMEIHGDGSLKEVKRDGSLRGIGDSPIALDYTPSDDFEMNVSPLEPFQEETNNDVMNFTIEDESPRVDVMDPEEIPVQIETEEIPVQIETEEIPVQIETGEIPVQIEEVPNQREPSGPDKDEEVSDDPETDLEVAQVLGSRSVDKDKATMKLQPQDSPQQVASDEETTSHWDSTEDGVTPRVQNMTYFTEQKSKQEEMKVMEDVEDDINDDQLPVQTDIQKMEPPIPTVEEKEVKPVLGNQASSAPQRQEKPTAEEEDEDSEWDSEISGDDMMPSESAPPVYGVPPPPQTMESSQRGDHSVSEEIEEESVSEWEIERQQEKKLKAEQEKFKQQNSEEEDQKKRWEEEQRQTMEEEHRLEEIQREAELARQEMWEEEERQSQERLRREAEDEQMRERDLEMEFGIQEGDIMEEQPLSPKSLSSLDSSSGSQKRREMKKANFLLVEDFMKSEGVKSPDTPPTVRLNISPFQSETPKPSQEKQEVEEDPVTKNSTGKLQAPPIEEEFTVVKTQTMKEEVKPVKTGSPSPTIKEEVKPEKTSSPPLIDLGPDSVNTRSSAKDGGRIEVFVEKALLPVQDDVIEATTSFNTASPQPSTQNIVTEQLHNGYDKDTDIHGGQKSRSDGPAFSHNHNIGVSSFHASPAVNHKRHSSHITAGTSPPNMHSDGMSVDDEDSVDFDFERPSDNMGTYLRGLPGGNYGPYRGLDMPDDDAFSYTSTENGDSMIYQTNTPYGKDVLANMNLSDPATVLKLQEHMHEQNRRLDQERNTKMTMDNKMRSMNKERNELIKKIDNLSQARSSLEQTKLDMEQKIRNLEYNLSEEAEMKKNAETLLAKTKEQLARKEEQFTNELEAKQKTELQMRNLQLDLRTANNSIKQLDDEKSDLQRQLQNEKSARQLQEQFNEDQQKIQQALHSEQIKSEAQKDVELADDEDSDAENKLEVADEDRKSANELLRKLRAENTAFKLEIEKQRTRHRDEVGMLSTETEELQGKIEELKNEIRLNEEALSHATIQYNLQTSNLRTEISVINSVLEKEKASKDKLEAELSSLKTRYHSSSLELDKSEQARNEAERRLQHDKEEMSRQLETKDKEVSSLKDNIQGLLHRITNLENKLNLTENELHKTEALLLEKNNTLNKAQKDLDFLQSAHIASEEKCHTEMELHNKLQTKLDQLQERHTSMQHENLSLTQQVDNLQRSIAELGGDKSVEYNKIIASMQADAEKMKTHWEERNILLSDQCSRLKEENRNIETRRSQLEQENTRLNNEIADHIRKISVVEANHQNLEHTKRSMDEEKTRLQMEIEKYREKCNHEREKCIEAQSKYNTVQDQLRRIQEREETNTQKLLNSSANMEAVSKSKSELEESYQNLKLENAKLEAEVKHERHRVEMLEKDLNDSQKVRNSLEALCSNLKTTNSHLEDKLGHAVITDLGSDEESTTKSLIAQEAEEHKDLWEKEVISRSKLGLKISQYEKQKQDAFVQLEEERRKHRKTVESKRTAEMKLEAEIDKNTQLQKEVSSLKAYLKVAKKRLKELDANFTLDNGVDSHDSRINSLTAEFDRERLTMESSLSSVRQQLQDLQLHLEREVGEKERLQAKNHRLQSELAELERLKKVLKKLELSKDKLESEYSAYKNKVESGFVEKEDLERVRREIEARYRMELNRKLEDVNHYLEEQARARDKLDVSRDETEYRIRDDQKKVQEENSSLRLKYEQALAEKESREMEAKRFRELYESEMQWRMRLSNQLMQTSDKAFTYKSNLEKQKNRALNTLGNLTFSGTLNGQLLDTSRISGTTDDLFTNKLKAELDRSINKHLEAAPHDNGKPVIRLQSDTMNSSYAKSNADYLEVLQRKYLV